MHRISEVDTINFLQESIEYFLVTLQKYHICQKKAKTTMVVPQVLCQNIRGAPKKAFVAKVFVNIFIKFHDLYDKRQQTSRFHFVKKTANNFYHNMAAKDFKHETTKHSKHHRRNIVNIVQKVCQYDPS